MMLSEAMKTMPLGDVWDYFCEKNNVPDDCGWFEPVMQYEKDVLQKRS